MALGEMVARYVFRAEWACGGFDENGIVGLTVSTPILANERSRNPVTRLDRYVLTLFLRTVFIIFCSLGGVFAVFHAFTSMDELVRQAKTGEDFGRFLLLFFGPFLLLLFDWTAAIVAVMAMLFTVGWLRRSGELTAILSAGVSHGRLLRPILAASFALVLVQLVNRECVIPRFQDSLAMKAKDLTEDREQAVQPRYDRTTGVLLSASSLKTQSSELTRPNLTLYDDYPTFGDALRSESAVWEPGSDGPPSGHGRPSGYRLRGVERPADVDSLSSVAIGDRPVLLTRRDHPWLQPGECFVVTTIDPDLLQTKATATKMASVRELARRVRNPAVHSSTSLRVLLHERILRPPLDLILVMLALPLTVNRKGKGLFVLIGAAIGLVLLFFFVKTVAGMLGSNGYLLTPAIAAWVPLLVLGPAAYVRFRDVQTA